MSLTPTSLGSHSSAANESSGVLTVTTSASIGDTVVVVAGGATATATMTIADSAGNTWTALDGVPFGNPTAPATVTYGWFSKLTHAMTSGTSTITVTRSTSSSLAFGAVKIPSAAGTQDGASKTNTGTGAAASTAAVPIQTGSIVFMILTSGTAAMPCAAGAGFTSLFNLTAVSSSAPRGLYVGYNATGVTNVTPTCTEATSDAWGTFAFAMGAPGVTGYQGQILTSGGWVPFSISLL